MKRYFTYILSFVMISCIAACTKSEDVVNPNAEGHMALRLVSSTMTRATIPGNGVGADVNDDNLYEDKLVSADLYFFDGEGSGNAVWHHRETFSNTREKAEITELTIPSNIMSAIFNTNTSQATLYVVANAPAGTLPTYEGLAEGETLPTMDELKAYTISTTSWKTSATTSSAQSSFVMDGEDKITKTNNEIGGTVALTRAAAKIELSITDVVSSVTVGGETWTPVLGDNDNGSTILVSLNYAVGGSYINGVYDKTFANDNTQQNYGFARDAAVTDKKAYNQAHPFYSYASDWGTGGANEPYLLLVVPWVKNGSTTHQDTYYQIPVGSLDAKQIKRNHYYKVKINVGTMGSFEPQTATEITPSYTVIDWSTGSITTDIKEARYLVVDENYVIANNLEDIAVGFKSSHPVEIRVVESTFGDYYTSSKNQWTAVEDDNEVTLDGTTTGSIKFHHSLDNTRVESTGDPEKRYDYQVNTVKVKIYQPGYENTYFQEVIIEQRPALYLLSDSGNEDENNYVMINTNRSYSSSGSSSGNILEWESVGTSSSGYYTLFTISVSSFDNSTANYLITDPRVSANNDIITQFASYRTDYSTIAAGDIEEDEAGDSDLSGYRRTIQGAAAENLVAPKFTVASACGTYKNGDSRIYAETSGYYRCASYQEAGYPAGRWRIPTPAELNVIGRLCAEGKITETIFVDGVIYMSSNGPYKYDEAGTFKKVNDQTYSGSIRCVYDTWYWKDKAKDDSKFIWGAEGDVAEKKAAGTYDTYFTPVQQ
ncbi:MAG: hypothetical protein IJD72_07935 [Alistipes sp.]|nr:hypothetical protein [Alistipes sp.]